VLINLKENYYRSFRSGCHSNAGVCDVERAFVRHSSEKSCVVSIKICNERLSLVLGVGFPISCVLVKINFGAGEARFLKNYFFVHFAPFHCTKTCSSCIGLQLFWGEGTQVAFKINSKPPPL